MRKLPPVLVVLLLLSILPSPATGPRNASAEIAPNSTATVTEPLNLRSGPSLSDSVIDVMPAGATVTLSGQEIGDYVFVTWDRQKGWAHRNWLDIRPPATSAGSAVTTDRLNLRTGPSLGDRVVTVMPAGATVTLTGNRANGFESVVYNGQAGWAFAAYLGGEAPPTTPTGTATTTDSLNLRDGPSLSDRVLVVMPVGAIVTLTGETRNGYRSVTWSGYSGWAHGDWLNIRTAPEPAPQPEPEPEPQPTTTAVTTDNLNLRAGPATSFAVRTVIPRGDSVVLTGESRNGYRSVSYNGFTGWAHGDWLVPEGATPPPVSTTTATTTDRLNLRNGPATTYTVLTVMPQGATVTLTGQSNNGFLSVSWNGTSGWAFGAFLNTGAAAPPEPPAPAPTPPPTTLAPFDATNTIVGPARGSADEAIAFAERAGAQRMDEVERYIREVYRVAPQVGFDPAIIVAQSALETGYWRSDRWVQELNPAGLGISGGPGATQPGFASGTISARAQMAHMHAEVFGSSQPLPQVLQGVDPTYQQVFAAGWAGTIRTIEDLSGTWAVDPEYHVKIVRVAREIFD